MSIAKHRFCAQAPQMRRLRARATALGKPRPARRASVLLLVMALLAMLGLFMTTMMYVGRLEAMAADSVVRTVAARQSSLPAMKWAVELLSSQKDLPTARTQAWSYLPELERELKRERLESRFEDDSDPLEPSHRMEPGDLPVRVDEDVLYNRSMAWITGSRMAQLDIQDLGGRININAIRPDGADAKDPKYPYAMTAGIFEGFVAERLREAKISAKAAPKITQSLLDRRFGESNETRSPSSKVRTISTRADAYKGGDRTGSRTSAKDEKEQRDGRRFDALGELNALDGMTSGCFQALEPFLTTDSSSTEAWRDPDGAPQPRVHLNRSGIDVIFRALRELYPSAPADLLGQFAANIVDHRGTNPFPTQFRLPGASPEDNPLLGYKPNPVISEVCPDVMSMEGDGDNGEYIEIFNPLDHRVDLNNWRLDWGTGSCVLRGTLPPGGSLVVTDDIQNANDPTPEDDLVGMGSFFDVFRLLGFGTHRQLIEVPAMDIPDAGGRIRLYGHPENGAVRLVDYLLYNDSLFNGLTRGFSKPTVLSHNGAPGPATPFEVLIDTPETLCEEEDFRFMQGAVGTPFASAADLLRLPSAYTGDQGDVWVFPLLEVAAGARLDARLLDRFTTEAFGEHMEAVGKINVNTASAEVLQALPGLTDKRVKRFMALRKSMRTRAINAWDFRRLEPAPFDSLSAFAASSEVWEGVSRAERVEALAGLIPLLTVHSGTFLVTAVSRPQAPFAGDWPTQVAWTSVIGLEPEGGAKVSRWNFAPWEVRKFSEREKERLSPGPTPRSGARRNLGKDGK